MQSTLSRPRISGAEEVTPRVTRIPHGIVNSYFLTDAHSDDWVLVDAGLRTSAEHIIEQAEARFGMDTRPAAIVLTHGHFDHVGALPALLDRWRVPVYAHPLEFPYLTGRCPYPPADPAVGGGLLAVMSRVFTRGPIDIAHHVMELPATGALPALPSWRWVHTPGHSPGHVSLFNESEKVLVAGDAIVTTRQESAMAVLSQLAEVNGPPMYFTPDWVASKQSVRLLALLAPDVLATGHGVPMKGDLMKRQLNALALRFEEMAMPKRGRYVRTPARMNETGVLFVPPPLPRVWPRYALTLAVFAGFVVGATMLARSPRRSRLA